jgi:hypothetical protein
MKAPNCFLRATITVAFPLLCVLVVPHAHAQACQYGNCSTASMALVSASSQCLAQSTTTVSPAGGSQTWSTTELQVGSGAPTTVYSGSLTVAVTAVAGSNPPEYGQCQTITDGLVCPGVWQTQVVEVIDASYNIWQWYLRAYGADVGSGTCVQSSNGYFAQQLNQNPVVCCQCASPPCPLIADLLDRGFAMTDPEKGVNFDFYGNGHPLKMAWTDPSHGNTWLVRPDDGQVSSGKQMFGNAAPQPPCPGGGNACFNGWRALAIYDLKQNGGNENGVIDPGDAVWRELRFWRDSNQNGKVDAGELFTLDELGIKQINLKYAADDFYTDVYGNKFTDKGSYSAPYSARSPVWDVWPKAIDAQGHTLMESESDPMPQIIPDCISH